MNTPTPRTDANESITCKEGDPCIAPDFARQLETELAVTRKFLADANRGAQVNSHINQSLAGQLNVARRDIAELNERLIDRRQTLMAESMQTQRRVIDWKSQSDEGLRLRCGELTSQEIRTIRAVLTAILPLNVTLSHEEGGKEQL